MKSFACSISLLLFRALFCCDASAQTTPKVVHVFVALADNAHQGIVPVPAALGNGDDADRNLYWGAAFGVRTFFHKNADWEQIGLTQHPNKYILERLLFRHRASGIYFIADAYRGAKSSKPLPTSALPPRGLMLRSSSTAPKTG